MAEAVRFNVSPAQIGPLFPAVGAAGIGFTVTVTLPQVALEHPVAVSRASA
jgi:hypothetical protein